jgi:uncharacterized protein YeaO (DUF488 family)
MKTIKTKRIYAPAQKADGYRVLVDRLWPRGLKKENAAVDLWLKEIAPSNELRKWFNHDPQKWSEFKKRYFEELSDKQALVQMLIQKTHSEPVTLLFGAKDEQHNNACALQEFLTHKKK